MVVDQRVVQWRVAVGKPVAVTEQALSEQALL